MQLGICKSAVLFVGLTALSGCAMDLGGFASNEPDTPPPPRAVAGSPAAQAQQQTAANQVGQPQYAPPQQPLPPSGQAAFAPAPKPGTEGFTASQTPAAPLSGRRLAETELRTMLEGRTVRVADGRTLSFGRAGSYQESRNGQAIAVGRYQIRDVSVCVQFTNGLSRCDSFVRDGDRLYVEDRNGQRLPATLG